MTPARRALLDWLAADIAAELLAHGPAHTEKHAEPQETDDAEASSDTSRASVRRIGADRRRSAEVACITR
jgi:hypothetical protein